MKSMTLLLLCCSALPTAGQEAASSDREGVPVRLSLAQAVERALEVSAGLRESEQLRLAAGAEFDAARAGRLPTANVGASYTRRSDVIEFRIPQAPGQPPVGFVNLPDNYAFVARANLPIYAGGRIAGQIDAARENEQAATLDLDTRRRSLVLETEAAYWSLVTLRESEQVLRDGLTAFDSHLGDARNRERFGLAARNDVLAVDVERERAELRRLRAAFAAEAAQANLVRLVQLPADAVIEPSEDLESVPPPSEEIEALVARALEARPERASLLARVRAAEAGVRVARSARLPEAGLTAGYLYANPNRNFVPPDEEGRHSWDVGVEVSMRVFDGGRSAASVARAQAQVEALRQRLADLERFIRLEVIQAQLESRASHAAIRVADQALESGRENHRVSSERYREGVIPSSELLDASVALLEAGLERTRALADARLAAAALDRAVAR